MRKLAAVGILVLFASFACGGGEEITVPDEPTATEEPSPAATQAGAEKINDKGTETFTSESFDVEIELDDFYFEPTFIKSPGAATAKVELHNEGDNPHTFTAPDLDVDEELQPGASKEIEIEIGTETRYEFWCRFHKDQGMRGAFQPH